MTTAVGPHEIVEDLSWPGTPSGVWLVVDRTGRRLIVKAPRNEMRHHVLREIDAHEAILGPLAADGHAQPLVAASRDLGVLVVGYLPGELVEGTTESTDPRTHHEAGTLLARIHGAADLTVGSGDHAVRIDDRYEADQNERTRRWLTAPHRIPADRVEEVRQILDRSEARPVRVVPTHGDWQPRNWLIESPPGRVRVIDFGRFARRPAQTDLVRCWADGWNGYPELEAVHLAGYGRDPRNETWPLECLRQAVSTAAWAHQMGDDAFEQHGLDMIDRALGLAGH